MMNRRSPRTIWLGLALIVAPCLVLIGLEVDLASTKTSQLTRSRELVVRTFEVITTAQALDQAIQDAERGQRGFLLTEDAVYLAPYSKGAERAPALLAKLKQLTSDNAEQQRRMPNLEHQITLKLAELARTLEVREREGVQAARQVVRTNAGLDAMHAINGLIEATITAENALLTGRLAGAAEDERSAANSARIGGGLAFVVMVLGVGLVLLAFRDVRRSEAGRYESEERFRLFVEGATDYAICLLDPRGHVTDWNAGAERITGYAAGEIIGQDFSCFYTEEDRKAEAPRLALEMVAREGRYETEAWRVRKDGSRFMANVVIARVLDQSGGLIGFAKITRDISERVRQQQALEQARAALAQSQKMEALGQLSGGIAHDFNNLLHVIKNAIEALQRRLRAADPDTARFLDMARRNADRAASLTQRVLAFSRRQPLDPKPMHPNKLVLGMAELLRQTLGESVAIETVLGSGAWWISADANQLEIAILNLAVNARDAMPKGGKLTIETANVFLDEAYAAAHEEVKAGQYVMIALSDTGTGMTKDVVAKAFEPFFTTKEVGRGTGLGLSQVYGFIKQSEGHVKIYSEPGEGTTVKLYLPRLADADASERPAEARPVPAGAVGVTILLVEDDDDVRRFTAELLRELGYRVLVAPDASSALHVLEAESDVHLLFTDVGLPNGLNGRQLADEACRRWPALKVLFTTAYARNAIIHHGRLDHGVELIVKPFTQSDLADKVRRVLDPGGGRRT